jgi:(E)-4-hydroxy-3-methylbut-2-enyl-diphosphate synthase
MKQDSIFTPRHRTEVIRYKSFIIGGDNPIALESMLKCRTTDVAGARDQLERLAHAGCDLCRVAVQNTDDADALADIVATSSIPLMADIHFRADLAERALALGLPVRLNPGNLSDRVAVEAIAKESQRRNLPLRIGVNSGSLAKKALEKHSGHVTAEGMVESLLELEEVCRSAGCKQIIASLKATSLRLTLAANRMYAKSTSTPLHIGMTEAGFGEMGIVHSSIGLGLMLAEGIGDTVRVSLTGDPVKEVEIGAMILSSLGMGRPMVRLISCPTCGRTRMPVEEIARQIWDVTKEWHQPITIAVMGCEVNGPGEAREADIGVAGTADGAVLFVRGEKLRRIKKNAIIKETLKEADELRGNMNTQ